MGKYLKKLEEFNALRKDIPPQWLEILDLNLNQNLTPGEINKAYRKKAMEWSSDKHGVGYGETDEDKNETEEIYRIINYAKEMLQVKQEFADSIRTKPPKEAMNLLSQNSDLFYMKNPTIFELVAKENPPAINNIMGMASQWLKQFKGKPSEISKISSLWGLDSSQPNESLLFRLMNLKSNSASLVWCMQAMNSFQGGNSELNKGPLKTFFEILNNVQLKELKTEDREYYLKSMLILYQRACKLDPDIAPLKGKSTEQIASNPRLKNQSDLKAMVEGELFNKFTFDEKVNLLKDTLLTIKVQSTESVYKYLTEGMKRLNLTENGTKSPGEILEKIAKVLPTGAHQTAVSNLVQEETKKAVEAEKQKQEEEAKKSSEKEKEKETKEEKTPERTTQEIKENLYSILQKMLPINLRTSADRSSDLRIYLDHPVLKNVCQKVTALDNYYPTLWASDATQFVILKERLVEAEKEYSGLDGKAISNNFESELRAQAANYINDRLSRRGKTIHEELGEATLKDINKRVEAIPQSDSATIASLLKQVDSTITLACQHKAEREVKAMAASQEKDLFAQGEGIHMSDDGKTITFNLPNALSIVKVQGICLENKLTCDPKPDLKTGSYVYEFNRLDGNTFKSSDIAAVYKSVLKGSNVSDTEINKSLARLDQQEIRKTLGDEAKKAVEEAEQAVKESVLANNQSNQAMDAAAQARAVAIQAKEKSDQAIETAKHSTKEAKPAAEEAALKAIGETNKKLKEAAEKREEAIKKREETVKKTEEASKKVDEARQKIEEAVKKKEEVDKAKVEESKQAAMDKQLRFGESQELLRDHGNPISVGARLSSAAINNSVLGTELANKVAEGVNEKISELQKWANTNNVGLDLLPNYNGRNWELDVIPKNADIKKRFLDIFQNLPPEDKKEFVEKFKGTESEWNKFVQSPTNFLIYDVGGKHVDEKEIYRNFFKTFTLVQRKTFQDDPGLFLEKFHEIERSSFEKNIAEFNRNLEHPNPAAPPPVIEGLAKAVAAITSQAKLEKNLREAYRPLKEFHDIPKGFFKKCENAQAHLAGISLDKKMYKSDPAYRDDQRYLEIFKEQFARIKDPFKMVLPPDLGQPTAVQVKTLAKDIITNFSSEEFSEAFKTMMYCRAAYEQMEGGRNDKKLSEPKDKLMNFDSMIQTVEDKLKNIPDTGQELAQLSKLREKIKNYVKDNDLTDALQLANICTLKIKDLEEDLKKDPNNKEKFNKKQGLEFYKQRLEQEFLDPVKIDLNDIKPATRSRNSPMKIAQEMLADGLITKKTGFGIGEASTAVKLKGFVDNIEKRKYLAFAQPLQDICATHTVRLETEISKQKKNGKNENDPHVKEMNVRLAELKTVIAWIDKEKAKPGAGDYQGLKGVADTLLLNPMIAGADPNVTTPDVKQIKEILAGIEAAPPKGEAVQEDDEEKLGLVPGPQPEPVPVPEAERTARDPDAVIDRPPRRGSIASLSSLAGVKLMEEGKFYAITGNSETIMRVTLPSESESENALLKRAHANLEDTLINRLSGPDGTHEVIEPTTLSPNEIPFGARSEVREIVHVIPENLHELVQRKLDAEGKPFPPPPVDPNDQIKAFGMLQSFDKTSNLIKIKIVPSPHDRDKFSDPNNMAALLDGAANIVKYARNSAGNPGAIRLSFLPRDMDKVSASQKAMLIYCASENLGIKDRDGKLMPTDDLLKEIAKDKKITDSLGLRESCSTTDLTDRAKKIVGIAEEIKVNKVDKVEEGVGYSMGRHT